MLIDKLRTLLLCGFLGLLAVGCQWPTSSDTYDTRSGGVPPMDELQRGYESYGTTP